MPRLAAAFSMLLLLALFAPVATRSQTPDPANESAADAETTEVVEQVVPPQVILKTQIAPTYPPAALAARFEGVVVLELQVLKDGMVGEVKIVECTHPNIGFEEAATEATRKWRFEAALKNGEPIDYTATFRMNFRVPGRGQPYVSWGAAGASTSDTGSAESRRDLRQTTRTGGISK